MQYVSVPLYEELSDGELAGLAAKGSGEAFAVLAGRFTPLIQSIAARYVRVSEMDDLTQEGLLGLLAATHGYREDVGEFGSYAAVCIRNRMVSALRRFSPVSEQWTVEEDKLGQADPETLFLKREEAQRLYSRLKQTLTPLEYGVLMRHLSGMSYREIGEAVSCSEKAVDNALQRVRRKLSPIMRQ